MTGMQLKLPSGIHLRADDQPGLREQYWLHVTAALSENLCPWCSRLLDAGAVCANSHPAVCWHICPGRQTYTEFYLDVPRPDTSCPNCGAPIP